VGGENMEEKKPSKKKQRELELREDGLKKSGGVDLSKVADRQMGDRRFEREKAYAASAAAGGGASSSTYDALKRMAAGLDGRTLAEKISDPNRPTWEQYKKDNEDKLDIAGAEERKMIEYRAQLDRERESKLSLGSRQGKKTSAISDSEEEDEEEQEDADGDDSDDDSSAKKKKSKKEKKRRKKEKKERKRMRREGGGDGAGGEDGEGGEKEKKKSRTEDREREEG